MADTLVRMPKPKKPPTDTVRMPSELKHRVERVAAHRQQTVPEYLAERLGPIVDKDEAQMLDEIGRERKKPRPNG